MFSTKRIIFSFILVTSLIGVICSTHVTASSLKESSLSKELEVNFPKMIVGDRWVYTSSSKKFGADTLRLKVIEVNPDGSYVAEYHSEKEKDIYHVHYDATGKLIRKTHIKTGKDIKINTPPPKYIDFPLFVGKEWSELSPP